MKAKGKRKKSKVLSPYAVYTRDRLDEQKRFIQRQFNVNPSDPNQVKNCNAVGFADAIKVYEYYKKIFKEQLKGKI